LPSPKCSRGVLHEAVEKRQPTPYAKAREAWGIVQQDPYPYRDADLDRATKMLRELDEQWQASAEPLEFAWPERLRAH
jgi:hypothetical protein